MGAAQKIIDKKTLQILVPFNALSPVHFNEVAQKTVVDEVRAGRQVFKEGDRDNQSVYLLEGEITLLAGNEIVGSVTAGSDASRHPLAHQQPRQVTARAKTNVVVARVDSSLLDIMLTWDQSSGYEVAEIDDDQDDDWMTRILQSQAFLKLPPSNIQRLLMQVESVPVKAGDVVIRQGGEGDYFYIIKNGRCMVSRKPSANAKEVKLAELADGDAFGEDALVSDAKRNATVTMMTDGVLMRLAKQDFVELLKEPLLSKLSYKDAAAKVAKGAEWLDVRLPGEFENVHITGSRNIPLSALRLEANDLDTGTKYIVCCDTGRRSASAAFVLSQRGFEVYVLTDGFGGVPPEALSGQGAKAAAEPAVAAVVDLKPATAAAEAPAPVAADTAQLDGLQKELEDLQSAKQSLETEHAKLTGRISDLQEELERVRDEAREQILELEQILADTRDSAATAQAALQQLEAASGSQEQAGAAALEQAQALETELAASRARESELSDQLEALKTQLGEFESARQAQQQQRAEADAMLAELQAELDTLRGQAQQAEAHLARIGELEAALQAADAQGSQAQTEQQQRLEALQARLDALETTRSDLEARLTATAEERDRALQSGQQSHTELQARIDALTSELEQAGANAAAQQALAESASRDLEALRETQDQSTAALQDETARLRAELDTAVAGQAALASERDALQAGIDAARAEAGEQLKRLQTELEQAHQRIQELGADAGEQVRQLEAALEAARQAQAAAESERQQLVAEQERLRAGLSELEAQLAASEQSHTEARAAQQSETASLQERLAAAVEAHAVLEQARDAAQAELDKQREKLRQLEEREADAAAGQDEQTRLLTEVRERLQAAESEARESAAARAEIEARLEAMSASANAAQAALEEARQTQQQVVAEAEQRVRADLEQRLNDLASELDGARAALARAQDQRGNLEAAAQNELSSVRSGLEADLEQAREEMQALQQELAEAESARRTVEDDLARTRAEASAQQQALTAEFEQLRLATSADVELMQKQIRQLTEELQAARKLSAGGSADEELARLRLLLDEAREEANSARLDADQWREQALSEPEPAPQPQMSAESQHTSDELDAMRVQLADIQCRVDEAMQLRDSAQQEAAELRQALQSQQLRESLDASAAAETAAPTRRGGLWMGLAAGLVLGVVGAGVALWQGGGAPAPAAAPAPTAAAPAAPPPAAAEPVAAAQRPASLTAAPTVSAADSAAANTAPAASPRILRDALGDGTRGPRLVEIAATEFAMGSGAGSLEADERPRRTVKLPRFAIGQYEVTFDEYDAFARATGRALPDDKGWGRGQRPVINISWEEAVAYTQWLSEQTGQRYRLPSEAEWEYAAGAAARTLYWWGNAPGEGRANCFNCGSEWDAHQSAPVGSFSVNPLGLHDTAGNVAEWVQDCYQPNYQGAPVDGSARITVGCTRRVVRGGGFNSPASTLRITKRDQQLASMRADDLGFRVVREL
ncbi:MAG: SUMF1/EgtB/PvdO family nonheme iron enzyme [Gammaproteobacteria bacterium]